LTGPAAFADATVFGADTLLAQGPTTVSGLTVAGTSTFFDAGSLTQSSNNVTVGDGAGNASTLAIAATGTWNITDDTGIGLGSSSLSSIQNSGTFEKTGGTGTSTIAPNLANAQNVLVSSGTLDLQGAVTGTGTDSISGPSTLEFDSTIAASQTINFVGGGGGNLFLNDTLGYSGSQIGGFAAGDNVELAGAWSLMQFSASMGGATLTMSNGTNQVALNFSGSFQQSDFTVSTSANTFIGHS
jgi:hypothetical protein